MIQIKTQEQIKGIRKSSKLAAACLNFIKPYVVEGVKTIELDGLIEDYILSNGAIAASKGYMDYPFTTCISVNEVICHGIPSEYKLREGDILNIDVATILNGYYGDNSRMYSIGKISKESQYIMQVAKDCLDIGIKLVRPKQYFENIGYYISKYAKSKGCSVVHQFCGHGTGLQYHEYPQICHISESKNIGPKMKPGMVFTIEPMINLGLAEAIISESDGWTATTIDGKLSAQYEHTILITKKGYEILTKDWESQLC